jgi:glycerol-3-phosphate acyltransferase PlsY
MVGTLLRVAIVMVVGYLLGGIPFGAIIAGGIYKTDITKLGSGATGGTNVLRSLGWRAAVPVGLLDIAKGSAAAIVARLVADPTWGLAGSDMLVIVAGVCAMLGHMYSPYFKLRGGKGIATAAGAAILLMPMVLPPLILLFAAIVSIWRIVSVGSLVTVAFLPLATWLLYPDRPVLLVFAAVAVVLVYWAHRSNIGRLMRGEEPRTTIGTTRTKKVDEKGGDEA